MYVNEMSNIATKMSAAAPRCRRKVGRGRAEVRLFSITMWPIVANQVIPNAPFCKPSAHQKLVIFTENRYTLNFLEQRVTTQLGRKEAVAIVYGGIGREERPKIQEYFRHDSEVQVPLATDAADLESGTEVPKALFDGAADNLLQNAIAKRAADSTMQIRVTW